MNSTHSLLQPSSANDPIADPQSTTLVRNFIEVVFNQGEVSQLKRFIHPAYRYRSPSEELNGIDALHGFIVAMRSAFPDLHVAVTEQLAEGPKVSTRVLLTGTQEGEFNGIPATGRPIKVEGVILSQVKDGLINEEWELLDEHALLRQLGLLPEEEAA